MKQAITNLSKQQSMHLQKLLHLHSLDAKTSSKAQKYYRQLRKLYHHLDQTCYALQDLMKVAVVIAQKSQIIYNIKGQKVKGLALSLNQMIKEQRTLGKIIVIIQTFLKNSKALELDLKEGLSLIVEELGFGYHFIQKFERAINYFDFQQLVDESYGYKLLFKSFTWTFFLQARRRLQIKSEFESDYLLISILYLMVRYSFDYLRPKSIQSLPKSKHNQKILVTSILQNLFQIFLIDDTVSFKNITNLVDCYFQQLIDNGIIKCQNFQYYDFLSPFLIGTNYHKIDSLYEKQRNYGSIDYRLFFKNRLKMLTPRKFTRLSQYKEDNHGKSRNFKQKSFASHKILTFQPEQCSYKNQSSDKFQKIKLPLNIKISPSNIKTPIIWAYQQSPCSPIQNYIYRQVRTNRINILNDSDNQTLNCIRSILSNYCNDNQFLQDKVNLTYNYYLVLTNKYLKQSGNRSESNQLHSSALIYTLLIMIITLTDHKDGVKTTLLFIKDYIVADVYYLWLLTDFFQKMEERIPTQLRELVKAIENIIICQLIWQGEEISDSFLQIYHTNLSRSSSISNKNLHTLLVKVIRSIQNQITLLMSSFQYIENRIQIQTKINKTIKYIILQTPQIIKSFNLNQIFLCSAYLIFKTNISNIKFNDIITAFQQNNKLNAEDYKFLISQIKMNQELEYNIIQFYNKYFLPFIKQHLKEIQFWQYQSLDASNPLSNSKSKNQRFHSLAMKQKQLKKHAVTQENESSSNQIKEKKLRLNSQSSIYNEYTNQKSPNEIRNQTTMRSRPPIIAVCVHDFKNTDINIKNKNISKPKQLNQKQKSNSPTYENQFS